MNCNPYALRAYASKVAALHGQALTLWRRPRGASIPVSSLPEPAEERWEGEGGRVSKPGPGRVKR